MNAFWAIPYKQFILVRTIFKNLSRTMLNNYINNSIRVLPSQIPEKRNSKNGITDIVNMKFHEFLNRVTLDHHAYMFLFWWMNNDFLQAQTPENKRLIAAAFHHMTTTANNDPKYTALSAYKAFKDKGGVVYVPTAAEKAQFVESVQPLKQWYVDKFGDKWLKMLEASIAQAEKEIAAEDKRLTD